MTMGSQMVMVSKGGTNQFHDNPLELGELALAYSEPIGAFFLFDTHFA